MIVLDGELAELRGRQRTRFAYRPESLAWVSRGGRPRARGLQRPAVLGALPVVFLANQSGAATDEIWFVAIFAIGAIVGLLFLALQFVGGRRPPADAARGKAPAQPSIRDRYCTRCGESLRTGAHACASTRETHSTGRSPGRTT